MLPDGPPELTDEMVAAWLLPIAVHTGGYVDISAARGYLPALIGKDGQAIPLHAILRVVAQKVDRAALREETGLSDEEIDGVFNFLCLLMGEETE